MSRQDHRSRTAALVLSFVLCLVFSSKTLAQSTGTLSGIVADPAGRAVSEVSIMLRNRSIGYERATRTDQDGLFQIAGLGAGVYQMEVRATGFRVQVVDE